jgi:hypothetical protein
MSFFFDVLLSITHRSWICCDSGEGSTVPHPEQVLKLPADFYKVDGLEKVLTYQRLNDVCNTCTYEAVA